MKNHKRNFRTVVGKPGGIALLMLGVMLVGGCESFFSSPQGRQQNITGEPAIFALDGATGYIIDRELWPLRGIELDEQLANVKKLIPETAFHKGEVIRITMDQLFVKRLQDLRNPHVLVFAQVNDDGTDDPATGYTTVLFNERNQPEDVSLGIVNKTIYGPTTYRGYPIRVKFHVVELDREDKEIASNILDSVAGAITTSAPQIAPAVGIGLSIAKFINALNEDDFELRFDMTFSTVAPIGAADRTPTYRRVGSLGGLMPRAAARLQPVLTANSVRAIAKGLPLRTGSYIIVKRELKQRSSNSSGSRCDNNSIAETDLGQSRLTRSYTTKNKVGVAKSSKVYVAESIRYEGGRVRRVIDNISWPGLADGKWEHLREDQQVLVVPKCGPNANRDFLLNLHLRSEFRDQTYVVIRFENFGESAETLLAGSMRLNSGNAASLVKSLLDDAGAQSKSAVLAAAISDIGLSINAINKKKAVARMAARRSSADPEFRGSTNYPAYWASQIATATLPASGKAPQNWTVAERNTVAANAGVLEILEQIVVDFPILAPKDIEKMGAAKILEAGSFETFGGGGAGFFKLSDEARKLL